MIALIAGEGQMPLRILQNLQEQGKEVLLLSLIGSSSEELEPLATYHYKIPLTMMGRAIKLCRKHKVTSVILAGRVKHQVIFSLSLFKFDWTTLRLWFSLKDKRANTIFYAIKALLEKNNMSVESSTTYLKHCMPTPGPLTKRVPTAKELDEISFGIDLAKKLSPLDIGQTIVIKNYSIVAVEAMEGTDQCIERAAVLAGTGIIVIKLAKASQEMGFDLPVIGLNTIEKLLKVKASLLVIEAHKTIVLDPAAITLADKGGLAVFAVTP